MSDNLANARVWLEAARKRNDGNTHKLGYMEVYLKKAGASYEDIGTTEQEVAQLLLDGHKAAACQWLEGARKRNDDNTYKLDRMEWYRKKAGASYEDIGTTEQEVAQLLLDGYKAAACFWLKAARERNGDNTYNLGYMERYREKAGVNYEDIGTTEREVAVLRSQVA